MTDINRELATKVLEVVDKGLVKGVGVPEPGKMCVEAAVCYAMGLPHGDNPTCVDGALRSLKIRLNDQNWSSDAARANGMRRLAIAQLGSAGSIDTVDFSKRVAHKTVQLVVPTALRLVASSLKNQKHAGALNSVADVCAATSTLSEVRAAAAYAADAADAAANAADAPAYAADAAHAAAYAATAAAYAAHAAADAAHAAAYAATAPAYAAHAAAYAANAAADSAANAAARDKVLVDFAEMVVGVLIEMNAPGCAFLDLAPLTVSAPAA